MATLQEQIAQAKAAGYSDADIAQHLSQKSDLAPKIKTAMDAGYKPEEIIAHLAGQPAAQVPEPKEQVSDSGIVAAAAGLGEGAGKVALGAQEYLGKGLRALGAENAGNWLVNDAQTGRAKLEGELAPYRQKSPVASGAGELGGEVLATLPVGGALGKAVGMIPKAAPLAEAVASGGFKTGLPAATTAGGNALNLGIRAAGGAVNGGATAALTNPGEGLKGAAIGAAMPGVAKLAGDAGKAVAGSISPEVAALYQKAKSLGIDIPVDRIANSKPLNALAASLNYVPLSGRAGTEEKMLSQMNRAVSRTFGQDSDNVTQALRKASGDLGAKFDQTLSNNSVKIDNQFLSDLASHAQTADNELGSEGAGIINKQINEIMSKGATGEIDGQAAYNIKKTLDRIGNRNSPEAFYARELKKSLMGALNRSLPSDEAQAFAKVRQQYGSMLDLENLAQNGAEGGISIGRLANLKHINNPDLQELADIAAQFVKSRESPHGAMQRVMLGALGGGAATVTGTLPVLGVGIAGSRLANTAMNSNALKSAILNQPAVGNKLMSVLGNQGVRSPLLIGATSNNP